MSSTADFANTGGTDASSADNIPVGGDVLTALTMHQVRGLAASDVAQMSVETFDSEIGANFRYLSLSAIAGVAGGQLASLSPAELSTLRPARIAGLSISTINALSPLQIGAWTRPQVHALTQAQVEGLGQNLFEAIDPSDFSPWQIRQFTASQASSLSSQQLKDFTRPALAAIDAADLTGAQIAALDASTVATMNVKTFDAVVAPNLSLISNSAFAAISTADVASLTPSQLAAFTGRQDSVAGLNTTNPVLADVVAHESNGALSYAGMLQVLQDAASGGMNATTWTGLQTLAQDLNIAGGISASAYVQQIAQDVINGNSANAYWNGGADTASALGNLSASSTQAQFDELIGKWFLGSDLPAIDASTLLGDDVQVGYAAFNLPLWNSGGPSINDINQGMVGDCYFLSALGEVALQDPTAIKDMIQATGNGDFSVEFQVNGKADYVTVNDELPTYASGSTIFDKPNGTLWAPLVEKAFAELMEQTSVIPGTEFNQNGDAYQDIAGGWSQSLTEITGQGINQYSLYATESASNLTSVLKTLQSALSGHQEVMMATSDKAVSGNLVADHMFMVTGVNATAGTVTLQNPWGIDGPSNMQMTFSAQVSTLATDGASLFSTTGKSVYG